MFKKKTKKNATDKSNIEKVVTETLSVNVDKALTGDLLQKMILSVVEQNKGSLIELNISEADKAALTAFCADDFVRACEDALQRMEVSFLGFVVNFRPGPVQAPMVRVLGRVVFGQHFAAGSVERVDVVAACDGVLALCGFGYGHVSEVVPQDALVAIEYFEMLIVVGPADGHRYCVSFDWFFGRLPESYHRTEQRENGKD
jgi:hypothetical protein